MLVSEAKEKVCPHIPMNISASLLSDEVWIDGVAVGNIKCICGDCMAWVWTKNTTNPYDNHEGYCSKLPQ